MEFERYLHLRLESPKGFLNFPDAMGLGTPPNIGLSNPYAEKP